MLADNRAALTAATRQRAHDTRERARPSRYSFMRVEIRPNHPDHELASSALAGLCRARARS